MADTSVTQPTPAPFGTKALIAVACAALILCIGMGIRQSFGLFVTPISSDLELGRTVFSLALAIQSIVWGISQPFAGAIADKYGAGRVVAISGLLYAAGLALASISSDPAALYLSIGLLIGLGLSGTTFAVVLGAVGRLVPENRRALALSITTIGGSIGMFALIPIGQTLIASMGWVQAVLMLSVLAALGIVLACALAGDPNEGAPAAQKQSLSEAIVEARGHSGFWLLTIGFFVCGFHVTFIAVHPPPRSSAIRA